MSKITFAVKINEDVISKLKKFCEEHGTKYSFFVEMAIAEKLDYEERKEDILDLKTLNNEEEKAIPFEEYLKTRNV